MAIQDLIQGAKGAFTPSSESLQSAGKGLMSAGVGAAADAVYNGLSGGKSSGLGNAVGAIGKIGKAIPGPIGMYIQGAGAVLGGGINALAGMSLNQEKINEINNQAAAANNFKSNASSFDEFMANAQTASRVDNFGMSDIGKAGPLAKGKLRKEYDKLKDRADQSNAYLDRSLINNADNISLEQAGNLLADYKAFGGTLSTNGADFSNGYKYIGNGDTHEKNPYQGVQMGVDQQGVPNLVEEGEFIYNEYVFSNRLKVNEKLLERYNLPKQKEDLTFADFAKKLSEENKERANDPISKRGLAVNMDRLKNAQEEVRQKKEAAKQRRQKRQAEELMTQMPPEEQEAMLQQADEEAMMQEQMAQEQAMQQIPQGAMQQGYAYGGEMGNIFEGTGSSSQQLTGGYRYMMPEGYYTLKLPEYPFVRHSAGTPNPEAVKKAVTLSSTFYNTTPKNGRSTANTRRTTVNAVRAQAPTIPKGVNIGGSISRAASTSKQPTATGGRTNAAVTKTPNPTTRRVAKVVTPKATSVIQTQPVQAVQPLVLDEVVITAPRKQTKNTVFGPNVAPNILRENANIENPLDYIRANYNAGLGLSSDEIALGKLGSTLTDEKLREASKKAVAYRDSLENGDKNGIDLRYAPVWGSALGLVHGLLNKPDYSNAETLENLAQKAGDYQPVTFNPIGDYLTYRPMDRMTAINQINAAGNATMRNVMNTSGGNRAAAMAGVLAAGNNYQNQIGSLFKQAEEYNAAQRERVATFNRGTNQYNSEGFMKAAMANQQARQQAVGMNAELMGKAMALRDAIDTRREASINANMSNLFTSLGNIGIDKLNRQDARLKLDRLAGGDTLDVSANIGRKAAPNSQKYGGKIKTKKRKGLTY